MNREMNNRVVVSSNRSKLNYVFLTTVSILVFAASALSQGEVVSSVPEVSTAARFDVSPPLRTMKPDLSTKAKKAEDDKGLDGPVGDFHHSPDGGFAVHHRNRCVHF